MCGVFAVFSPDGAVCEGDVIAGTRRLSHRGPDGEGFYIDPQRVIGLGHRRLAVIAPQNGRQPVTNESGTIRAVINGEFYDHEQQRRELESRAHRFSTSSDSEALVHLYEDYGVSCLQYLQGEFAFILWDADRQQVFAARDRFGVKPLVYTTHGADLSLASEAKALFAAGVRAEWDPESFFFAANLQYLPPDRTLFRGVAALPAACFLVATRDAVRVQRYWQPDRAAQPADADILAVSEEELILQCRQHLVSAVKCRLKSDLPLCAQLSGGLDSSAVAGIAASMTQRPVDVFSLSFGNPQYDEIDVAAATARHLGATLHKITITPECILQTLAAAVTASEGLAINGHLSAKYMLHAAMRQQGFGVTLTGEGADEAFFGYSHLRMDGGELTSNERIADAKGCNTSVGMMLPHGETLDLTRIKRQLNFVPSWMKAKATLGWKVQQLIDPDALQSFFPRDAFCEMAERILVPMPLTPVESSRELWTRLALSGYILKTLGDGTEMPHSIEGRVPFLDHRLWEFLRTVPLKRQLSGTIEKPLLRAAVEPFVTPEVYRRPKHPLDAPPVFMDAKSSASDFLRDHLQSDAMRSQPFFCKKRINRILRQLDSASDIERQAWDPAMMMLLSALIVDRMMCQGPRDVENPFALQENL